MHCSSSERLGMISSRLSLSLSTVRCKDLGLNLVSFVKNRFYKLDKYEVEDNMESKRKYKGTYCET